MTKETSPLVDVHADLEFLVENIVDPRFRTYLRVPVSAALQRIGHDPMTTMQAVNEFFNVTLQ